VTARRATRARRSRSSCWSVGSGGGLRDLPDTGRAHRVRLSMAWESTDRTADTSGSPLSSAARPALRRLAGAT